MPNPVPIGGQFFVLTHIRQFANPGQSVPIHANPCQSGANLGPIFRSDTNLPICQSLPIRANPVPIHADPCQSMPIRCQSGANFSFRHKFANLPILANPCQSGANPCRSMSIHANPVPIRGQFFVPTQIRQFANLRQSVPIRANPCQSMPIHVNPCQSGANPGPIFCFDANSP